MTVEVLYYYDGQATDWFCLLRWDGRRECLFKIEHYLAIHFLRWPSPATCWQFQRVPRGDNIALREIVARPNIWSRAYTSRVCMLVTSNFRLAPNVCGGWVSEKLKWYLLTVGENQFIIRDLRRDTVQPFQLISGVFSIDLNVIVYHNHQLLSFLRLSNLKPTAPRDLGFSR